MRRRAFGLGGRCAQAVLALMVMLAAATLPAAAQGTGGALVGTITDAQGGVLPGVTVTVRNVDTGLVRTTVSEADGQYRIPALPPGRYDVAAELQGFAGAEAKSLTLNTGLELRRDLTLGLTGVQESITVTGEAPVVEATKTEVAGIITQAQIESLPIESRSAISLALLMPGTGTDNTRSRRPSANVGVGGVTVGGTNYLVDGLNNMISRSGDAREDVPQSAIQEFKVHVTQMPAEYGGRVGGVVSVVTKSGTNQFSGEAFEFFRHKTLNRMDAFQQRRHDQNGDPKPNFRRDQFGGAIGGPILVNRVHFFGTTEFSKTHEYFTVATGKPALYGSQEGTFQGGNDSHIFFGRLDLELNAKQTLFFRHSRQKSTEFCSGCGGTTSSFGTDVNVPGFTYFLGHTWVLSNRLLNEFALLYAESNQKTLPSDRFTPAGISTAVGSQRYVFPSFSWGAAPGTAFNNQYRQFRDSLTFTSGRHTWKAGGGLQWLPTHMVAPGNPLGTWTFGTDQYFNPGDPNFNVARLTNAIQFVASFPPNHPENLSHTYEAYVQDEWKPFGGLTLNLGLRYDLQTKIWNEDFTQARYPTPLPYVVFAGRGDKNNVAPRVGFAWDLNQDGHTVLRGGYGEVFVNVQNGSHDGEINDLQQYSVNIRNPSYPDAYQGRDPMAFVSTAPANITISANNVANPVAQTYNGGFSQQLGPNFAVNVDGVYTKTDDFPVGVKINEPDPVTGVKPLAQWGHITQIQRSEGSFIYKALLVRLDKRLTHRYQYMVSYTLAKQDNQWTGNNMTFNITDARHPEYDQGPWDTDRRHALTASGAVLLPADMTLGAVWTLRSSMPFNAVAGIDLNADGSNTDYVPGTTRNQGNRALDLAKVNAWRAQNRLAPIPESQIDNNTYKRLDVRISKAITLSKSRKLEFIGQVCNVLGTDNLGGGWVTNALSDSFGRLLAALPRQQAEIAARFVF